MEIIQEPLSYGKLTLPAIRFSGDVFEAMLKPCVYGWKREEVWLYIGSSKNGILRALQKCHKVFGAYELQKEDELIVWFVPNGMTEKKLRQVEVALIQYHNPVLNVYHSTQHGPQAKTIKRRLESLSEAERLLKVVGEE